MSLSCPCQSDHLLSPQKQSHPESTHSSSGSDSLKLSISNLPPLPQNIFIPTLRKLQQLAAHSSVTQLLQCQVVHREATQHLKQLSAKQIKESLLVSIENDLNLLQSNPDQHVCPLQNAMNAESKTKQEDLQKLWVQYLEILKLTISTYLRKKWSYKPIYHTVGFRWTPAVLNLLDKQTLINECHNCLQEDSQEDKAKSQQSLQNSPILQPWSQSRVYDLIKSVQNPQTANLLYLVFHHLLNCIAQKDSQTNACLSSNDELNSILERQIHLIATQEQEQEKYKAQLLLNQKQLDKLTERCKKLESDLSGALKSFDSLKEEEHKQVYYMNPLFDKSKLEEKYMTEIIQLQSDLYMEKGQVKTLVDLFVDQTKKTHHAFFDLGANSYFVSRYDKDLHKQIKYLKPFDGVNFDELLSLKEEEDMTECTHQMHRSTISIFSSIQMEGAVPVLGEEEFEGEETA